MTVLECAFLKLIDHGNGQHLSDVLRRCCEVQDAWHQKHASHVPYQGPHLSAMSIQQSGEDLPSLLINAPWQSVQNHLEWTHSKENNSAMGDLTDFLPDAADTVTMLHLEPVSMESGLGAEIYGTGQFTTYHFIVAPENKELVEEGYQQLRIRATQAGSKDVRMWAGWNVDKNTSMDDLVMFCKGNLPEDGPDELKQLADRMTQRYYQHVL